MSGIDELQREVRALRAEVSRQRHHTRMTLGLGALATGIFLLVGAGEPSKVLRADRIEIGDKDSSILLASDERGPHITLSTGDDRTTRLSMAGLEVTTVVSNEPSDRPSLDDPGFAPEDPQGFAGGPVTVDVGTDVYVSHLEVTCQKGFRNRAVFTDGRAVLQVPGDAGDCIATFGGGLTAVRLHVKPSQELECRRLGAGAALACVNKKK